MSDLQSNDDKELVESGIPELHDRRHKPEGVVPRQSQAYVIAGLSVLILLAVLFSNRRAKPATSLATTAILDTTPGTNEAVQQFSRELNEEQKENGRERAQQKAEQNTSSGTAESGASASRGNTSSPTQTIPPRDAIADAERALRFKSRFESNLVAANNQGSAEADIGRNYWTSNSHLTPEVNERPATVPFLSASTDTATNAVAGKNTHRAEISVNNAHGQPYAIFEGTTIDTVLVNRLDGDFAGPVKVMVTNPVFSQDRQHVLIPEGTFMLGEVQKVSGFGQRRLAVSFHRMIMPDGYSVDLEQFHGLDASGATGLTDKVNNHYLQIFGSSIALGVIAGAAEATTNTGLVETGSDALRQGMAASLAQSADHVLDRFLNILPTITIREGHRIKVYLTEDLLLPAYENHAMPGDL